ncbi:hypothetical protein [Streptomyces sp. SID8358]|uniref:hypothetical protein n=1 Tax=Streptomyces sp. SID8358 TaxID=2690342 RepID=UPI000DAF6797|nr:hypothetical protein [Streptomyces sp. SID8358]
MRSHLDLAAEDLAVNVLVGECLKRFGLEPANKPNTSFFGPTSLLERRYGLLDQKRAADYGYWMPAPATDGGQKGISADETIVTYGVVDADDSGSPDDSSSAPPSFEGKPIPKEGCIGEAQRTLSGDENMTSAVYGEHIAWANDLQVKSFFESRSEPKVHAAEAKWSSCMKDHGYSFPADVFAAVNSLEKTRERPRAGSAETELAVADTGCRRTSDVAALWYEADARYQAAETARNAAKWADSTRFARTVRSNVASVLEKHRIGAPFLPAIRGDMDWSPPSS